jgi:Double zinc ribbon
MSPLFRRGSPRRSLPPTGVLRRERRALGKVREERLRDLGGLLLEMFRRDHFREDLIRDRCEELLELDERLAELDVLLGVAGSRAATVRCSCGAPVPWGSHFCPNCGRPAGEAPVVTCAACGHALPADASFCARCGAPAGIRTLDAIEGSAER